MIAFSVLSLPVRHEQCRRCKGALMEPSTMHEDSAAPCVECDGRGRMVYRDKEAEEPTAMSPAVKAAAFLARISAQRQQAQRDRIGQSPGSPSWSYVATSAADLVEEGVNLEALVLELSQAWPALDGENLAVWRLEGNMPPRLVAYLFSGPDGKTLVKWI